MLPEQPISYPEFVADQLLTAANLNDLFQYLDQQERATRTHLVGIGIVCGLEVQRTGDAAITISRGCGITSQGYLVHWEEATFQNYKPYDARADAGYDLFFREGEPLKMDELVRAASGADISELTNEHLQDKVVLLFVELQVNDAKNCDPESCDDKGRNIVVTFRPLLVSRTDAEQLANGLSGAGATGMQFSRLPEMKMPRHHLPAATISSSGDVLGGFHKVLTGQFFSDVEKHLAQIYERLSPLVQDTHPTNPFEGLAETFAFIPNNDFTSKQALYLQYYYDLFSDVLEAGEELRRAGMKLLSLCCPDENLFPRHLLLGLVPGGGKQQTAVRQPVKESRFQLFQKESAPAGNYRQYFIQSPAVACHRDLVEELRMLLTRLVLLLQRFNLDDRNEPEGYQRIAVRKVTGKPVRITPSRLGPEVLSKKSIPFYYDVATGTDKLYQHWSFWHNRQGMAQRILSYHADDYNKKNPEVLQPLDYDLKDYNFLRIEGHVGRRYPEALADINKIRDTHRLPFETVALSADIRTLREQLAIIANGTSRAALKAGTAEEPGMQCHFQDLEALYDTLAQGLLCQLCKEMKYYYGIVVFTRDNPGSQEGIPQAPLLRQCDPYFRYKSNTMGELFEAFYAKLPAKYIEVEQFLNGAALGTASGSITNVAADNSAVLGYALLYYIEKLSEILTTTLSGFNIAAFAKRYDALMQVAQKVKELQQAASLGAAGEDNELSLAISEDIIDHLDVLLYACKDAQFLALYNDYKMRWIYLSMLQKFGYYVNMHPGFQHKAGVPMGGTFILVYHERSRVRKVPENIFIKRKTEKPQAKEVTEETEAVQPERITRIFKEAAAAKAGTAEKMEQDQVSETSDSYLKGTKSSKKILSQAALRRLESAKLKSSLSKKQMTIIDRLFFKDLKEEDDLQMLTDELPDKIVIADFYLPYLCASDCPPVYFLVNETKEEEEEEPPVIELERNEFCQQDDESYTINVRPAGGKASGTGVSYLEKEDRIVFRPYEVTFDSSEVSKEITLTYTLNGRQAQTVVNVFQQPDATFQVMDVVTHVDPNTKIFSALNGFAAQYDWDFGDGQKGADNQVQHRFEQPGTYTVQLMVTNGPCRNSSTQNVVINKPSEQPTKNCLPLADILQAFDAVQQADPDQFKSFSDQFEPFTAIQNHFKSLKKVSSGSVNVHLKFFLKNETGGLLETWMGQLNDIMENSEVRVISLELWRVLTLLALYIMCIQDNDFNENQINLESLFKQLEGWLKGWVVIIPKLSKRELKQLKALLETMKSEQGQMEVNGDKTNKKDYYAALEKCIAILEKYFK